MSDNNKELQRLLTRVESLKSEIEANFLFDSSLFFAFLNLIESAQITKKQLLDTLASFSGGFQAEIKTFLSPVTKRKKINQSFKTVFQP